MDYKWFKKNNFFFIFYFLDYWLKGGHFNRSVDIRYSIVAVNTSLYGNLGSGEKSVLLFQYHYHSHIMDFETNA